MTEPDALAGWLRLTLISGIGGATQRRLLGTFGLPEVVFSAGFGALSAVCGDKAARLLLDTDNAVAVDEALSWVRAPDHHIVTLADPAYPAALLEIPDPPSVLYVVGRIDLLKRPALAIVGSRNPTPQGMLNAEQFAGVLADAGLTITSGMALGIDAAAHRGALASGGDTIAFVGTGADRIYPARNKELAQEIGAKGTIVSEFPLGTPVTAFNFPRRNRLISGLALGVLVVEAAMESGSLITARLAGEQGREVFAIPGSIHSPQSRGCHRLIKQGAKLVETAQDVLEELNWGRLAEPSLPRPEEADVASGHNDLLAHMGFDPCGLDDLAGRSGLTADTLSVMLLHLELDGHVASLPGGRYQRLAHT